MNILHFSFFSISLHNVFCICSMLFCCLTLSKISCLHKWNVKVELVILLSRWLAPYWFDKEFWFFFIFILTSWFGDLKQNFNKIKNNKTWFEQDKMAGKVTFFGSVGQCRCNVDLFTISKEELFLKFWFCQVCRVFC